MGFGGEGKTSKIERIGRVIGAADSNDGSRFEGRKPTAGRGVVAAGNV